MWAKFFDGLYNGNRFLHEEGVGIREVRPVEHEQETENSATWKPTAGFDILIVVDVEVSEVPSNFTLTQSMLAAQFAPLVREVDSASRM